MLIFPGLGTLAQASVWRLRANNFREQAEPFDIANFYLSRLNVRSGPYLYNRPGVYAAFEEEWRKHSIEQQSLGAKRAPQQRRGQPEQRISEDAVAGGRQQDAERAEAVSGRLKALETYMSALPWAHQAEEKIGWTAVGSWTPEGPALQEVPVVVSDEGWL